MIVMDENDQLPKTFKEGVDNLGKIKARYVPIKTPEFIPARSYERVTRAGMGLVEWFREHVREACPCKDCGSGNVIVTEMDTDTAWVTCQSCRGTRAVPWESVKGMAREW